MTLTGRERLQMTQSRPRHIAQLCAATIRFPLAGLLSLCRQLKLDLKSHTREGDLQMWWKIFAVLFAVSSLWAIFDASTYETTWGALGLVMTLPATMGLLLFAFNKSFLSKGFWKAFAVIYIAYSAVVLVIAIQRWVADHDQSGKSIWVYIIAFAIGFAIQFFASLGLWRHSVRTSQSV